MPHPFFSHSTVFGERNLVIGPARLVSGAITNGDEVVPVDATAGAVTITLPLSASSGRGRQFYFVKVDAVNNVTIQAEGADVIGYAGGTSATLTTQDQVLHLIGDGAGTWIILHA